MSIMSFQAVCEYRKKRIIGSVLPLSFFLKEQPASKIDNRQCWPTKENRFYGRHKNVRTLVPYLFRQLRFSLSAFYGKRRKKTILGHKVNLSKSRQNVLESNEAHTVARFSSVVQVFTWKRKAVCKQQYPRLMGSDFGGRHLRSTQHQTVLQKCIK